MTKRTFFPFFFFLFSTYVFMKWKKGKRKEKQSFEIFLFICFHFLRVNQFSEWRRSHSRNLTSPPLRLCFGILQIIFSSVKLSNLKTKLFFFFFSVQTLLLWWQDNFSKLSKTESMIYLRGNVKVWFTCFKITGTINYESRQIPFNFRLNLPHSCLQLSRNLWISYLNNFCIPQLNGFRTT